MEDLNKNQIILLTLLVSFVTSIATGIMTTTLMDEAPPGVTQTINRVVERTIERVVPGEASVATVIREVPVITTDQELVVGVVAAAAPAVVSITAGAGTYLGTGFLATDKHWVVTADQLLVLPDGTTPTTFMVTLSSGAQFTASRVSLPSPLGVGVLRLERAVGDAQSPEPLPFLPLSPDPVVTGQSVVALSLPTSRAITIADGLVTSLRPSSNEPPLTLITTEAVQGDNLGGPLLNLQGQVIGINKEVGSALDIESLTQVLTSLL